MKCPEKITRKQGESRIFLEERLSSESKWLQMSVRNTLTTKPFSWQKMVHLCQFTEHGTYLRLELSLRITKDVDSYQLQEKDQWTWILLQFNDQCISWTFLFLEIFFVTFLLTEKKTSHAINMTKRCLIWTNNFTNSNRKSHKHRKNQIISVWLMHGTFKVQYKKKKERKRKRKIGNNNKFLG